MNVSESGLKENIKIEIEDIDSDVYSYEFGKFDDLIKKLTITFYINVSFSSKNLNLTF